MNCSKYIDDGLNIQIASDILTFITWVCNFIVIVVWVISTVCTVKGHTHMSHQSVESLYVELLCVSRSWKLDLAACLRASILKSLNSVCCYKSKDNVATELQLSQGKVILFCLTCLVDRTPNKKEKPRGRGALLPFWSSDCRLLIVG